MRGKSEELLLRNVHSTIIYSRNIEFLNKCLSTAVTSVNPELGRGEIVITLPSEAQHMIQENQPLRIAIEFSLEKPQCGLQFVVPEGDGTMAEVINELLSISFNCIHLFIMALHKISKKL